jgi:hypothetical protein
MQEARDQGGVVERELRRTDGETFYVLNGNRRFHNGYLQKVVSIKSLVIQETMPPLDELQRFKQVTQVSREGRAWYGGALGFRVLAFCSVGYFVIGLDSS